MQTQRVRANIYNRTCRASCSVATHHCFLSSLSLTAIQLNSIVSDSQRKRSIMSGTGSMKISSVPGVTGSHVIESYLPWTSGSPSKVPHTKNGLSTLWKASSSGCHTLTVLDNGVALVERTKEPTGSYVIPAQEALGEGIENISREQAATIGKAQCAKIGGIWDELEWHDDEWVQCTRPSEAIGSGMNPVDEPQSPIAASIELETPTSTRKKSFRTSSLVGKRLMGRFSFCSSARGSEGK